MKALILFFLSASLYAQVDYQLLDFGNDDYRKWSKEDMALLLGENAQYLDYYQCNGVDELDLFKPSVRSNPERSSLKIKGFEDKKIYTYRDGLFFDEAGSPVLELTDSFLKQVSEAFAKFETIAVTHKLIRLLEEAHFPVTITKGYNMFDPKRADGTAGIYQAEALMFFNTLYMPNYGHFTDIGSGGSLYWHPTLKSSTIDEDGVKREANPLVVFAHELFHALDSVRGLIDFRTVMGKKYAPEPIHEYRGVYFENVMRKELGLKLRKFYTDEPEAGEQDMLDDNGDPINLPAPCLK